MLSMSYLLGCFAASFAEAFGAVVGAVFAVFILLPVIVLQLVRVVAVLRR